MGSRKIYILFFYTALIILFSENTFSTESKSFSSFVNESASFNILVENDNAFELDEGEFQKSEFILEPEVEVELPFDLTLTAIGRLRLDALNELGLGDPSQPTYSFLTQRYIEDDNFEMELRELYLDGSLKNILFRLGKQQIVWGKADGLKVLDVVNPQSFREFILDDFDDSRIPLWALNLEIPFSSSIFQLIWIPDRTFDDLAESGSTFEITSSKFIPDTPEGVIAILSSPQRPRDFFTDSEFGVRLSTFLRGWDLTFNYLYHFDDLPVLFRDISMVNDEVFVTVKPEFRRTNLIGGTFSNAFGNLTVRGEVGYSTNQFYLSRNPEDSDGVNRGSELSYVLGFDWFGFQDALLSIQFFQTFIFGVESISQNEFDNTGTLLIQKNLLNETLELEVLLLQSINDGDGLIRPNFKYQFNDQIILKAGFDIFYGDSNGLFGQFDDADRFVFGFEYGLNIF